MANDIHYIPEWELKGRILLALPHADTDWNYILPEAVDQYRRLITAFVSHGEEVLLLVPDVEKAKASLADCPLHGVEFVEMTTNDTWTRDYGPVTVVRNDRMRAIDFGFNGWGLKFAACHDNLVNLHLCDAGIMPKDMYRNCRSFILEGGSLETDGQGTLLTTSECLLSPNRNGDLTIDEIADKLKAELGVDHLLWLNHGGLEGDDTDSHIDTLCRLAPDNVIFFTGCRDVDDSHFEELLKMRAELTMLRNAEGEPFNLVELPLPDPIYDEEGCRLPATYANYLVTPRAIYMPTYRQPQNDLLACNTVKIAFPEHEVVGVDCCTLIRQHGSLHCSTMVVPF